MTGHWDEVEAEFEEIADRRAAADAEMAEMDEQGDAIARAERAGICTHGSVSAGPKTGQLRCTKNTGGCAAVFDSDDEWYRAMDAAVGR